MLEVEDKPHIVDPTEALVPVPVTALEPIARCFAPANGGPPLFIQHDESQALSIDALIAWIGARRAVFDRLILEHGGIVMRGFPVVTVADFDRLIGLFPAYDSGYAAGMSPRQKVTGKVLESTRMAEDFKIILHSEMAYMKSYPPRIAFFSRQTSKTGGATTIGSAREFLRRIPAPLREKLERHKVHIIRNYAPKGSNSDAAKFDTHEKVGWDAAFFTDDPSEVERKCREFGMEFFWNDDGSLTLLDVSEPFTIHPKTGERFYRNNLHANRGADGKWGSNTSVTPAGAKRPSGQFLDNGEPLEPTEAETIRAILDEIEMRWQWHDGDIMILDNLQVLHGRETFTGPREVLVALLD